MMTIIKKRMYCLQQPVQVCCCKSKDTFAEIKAVKPEFTWMGRLEKGRIFILINVDVYYCWCIVSLCLFGLVCFFFLFGMQLRNVTRSTPFINFY